MKTEPIIESGMEFGGFETSELFHIEKSQIYKKFAGGIKTVEFILKYNENCIFFLEAKESCPNADNRMESEEKNRKFEEYYSSITNKFIDSLQVYLAAILGRCEDASEIGSKLKGIKSLKGVELKFVLVIKNAVDMEWLAGPTAELNNRLLKIIKIWGAKVVVLNEELAIKYKLISRNNRLHG